MSVTNAIEINLDEDGEAKQLENFDVKTVEAEFTKYSVEEVLKASEEIDIDKVAEEVITWLNCNLENFIDNTAKMFKIPIDDLDVEAKENQEIPGARPELYPKECLMTETKRLQSLYRGIPDDIDSGEGQEEFLAKCQVCRMELDDIVTKAFEVMKEKTDLLEDLYQRMIYYYEFHGFDKTGKEIVEDFNGLVSVLKFEYEAFSVGVKIREGSLNEDDGADREKAVVKEYVIPEGFVVWIELALKSGGRPSAMF